MTWPDTLPSWLAGAFLVALVLVCAWCAWKDMCADRNPTPDDPCARLVPVTDPQAIYDPSTGEPVGVITPDPDGVLRITITAENPPAEVCLCPLTPHDRSWFFPPDTTPDDWSTR